MVPPPVDFMDITARLATIPSLAPRPHATNLRALTDFLVDILTTIPSAQTEALGYQGMVQNVAVYALHTNVPWADWPDPGPTRLGTPLNPDPRGELNVAQVREAQAVWEANKQEHCSQTNVKRAVIDSLNRAVPKSYRRAQGGNIGAVSYRITDNPRDILDHLSQLYGRPTPKEKKANNDRFSAGWDRTSESIEDLFSRLEECYVTSIIAAPPYTMEQMIDKGVMAIQSTGLYQTAMLEWNGFDPANKTWPELKSHFSEAYEIHLATALDTAGGAGYHGMNNAEGDDDSLGSIQQSLAGIQLANNANAQTMMDSLSAITEESRELRAQLAAQQQQLAMLAQGNTNPMGWPAYQPPYAQPALPLPQANIMQPPPVPAYVPATQRNRNRNWAGRGRGGGRGGGRYPPAAAVPNAVAPPPGFIPRPPGGATQARPTGQLNTSKYFNNWNICCKCGWDVPSWHTSATCPYKAENPHHCDAIIRGNAKGYIANGWNVSKKGMHKVTLPTNPHEGQA